MRNEIQVQLIDGRTLHSGNWEIVVSMATDIRTLDAYIARHGMRTCQCIEPIHFSRRHWGHASDKILYGHEKCYGCIPPPTVSSIGVSGSNRWPICTHVSLVREKQNRICIEEHRYSPTAAFQGFSSQNQRCASYSSHADWHIPVDQDLLRYSNSDVDHVQQ